MPIDPTAVSVGAGLVYVAPIGTAEPTSAAGFLPVGFQEVGYTKSGSQLKHSVVSTPVEVPWEYEPTMLLTVSRTVTFTVELAQTSINNLLLALNNGSVTNQSSISAPLPGNEVRFMLALAASDGSLWLFRQCINQGDLTIKFAKAPDYTTLPCEFALEKPVGAPAFSIFPSTTSISNAFPGVFEAVF